MAASLLATARIYTQFRIRKVHPRRRGVVTDAVRVWLHFKTKRVVLMFTKQALTSTHQGGIYLIWVFVWVPMMLGFLALSIDTGVFLNEKAKAQTAADAAALAGVYVVRRLFDAEEVIGDPFGADAQAAVHEAAGRAATENGFEHSPPEVTVNVTYPVPDSANPPSPYPLLAEKAGGTEAGTAAYVRVTITQKSDSVFASYLGIVEGEISVTALGRYKEKKPRSCPGIFIYPDDPRRPQQLDLKQASQLSVSDGGIYIDSDHENALSGSAGSTVTADWIQASGGTGNATIVYECQDNPTPCPELYKDLDPNFSPPQVTEPIDPVDNLPACGPSEGVCGTADASGNLPCPCTLSSPTCQALGSGACRVFSGTTVVRPSHLPPGPPVAEYCILTAGKYCNGLTIDNNTASPFKVKLQPYVRSGGLIEYRDDFFYMMNGVLDIDKTTVIADDAGTGHGITIYAPNEGGGSTFSVDLDYSRITSWEVDDCDVGVPASTPDGSVRIWAGRLGLAHASCLNMHSYQTSACGSPLVIYTGLVP